MDYGFALLCFPYYTVSFFPCKGSRPHPHEEALPVLAYDQQDFATQLMECAVEEKQNDGIIIELRSQDSNYICGRMLGACLDYIPFSVPLLGYTSSEAKHNWLSCSMRKF